MHSLGGTLTKKVKDLVTCTSESEWIMISTFECVRENTWRRSAKVYFMPCYSCIYFLRRYDWSQLSDSSAAFSSNGFKTDLCLVDQAVRYPRGQSHKSVIHLPDLWPSRGHGPLCQIELQVEYNECVRGESVSVLKKIYCRSDEGSAWSETETVTHTERELLALCQNLS